jgi:repressor LexA
MREAKGLTTRQAQILGLLRRSPDALMTDLAAELGIHLVTLKEHLAALEKKGFVSYESRGMGRSPLIRLKPQAEGIPLVGEIPAGPLSEALAQPEGYLSLAAKPGRFALRVQGDSMAELIQDGDVVLLDKRLPERSGEVCAVRIDHSEVTLKYLEWRGQKPRTYTLRAHNPSYPAQKVKAGEIVIEGVFFSLIRGGLVHELLSEASM